MDPKTRHEQMLANLYKNQMAKMNPTTDQATNKAEPTKAENIKIVDESIKSIDYLTSFPQRQHQIHGYGWSTGVELNKKFSRNEVLSKNSKAIYIDNFAVSERFTGISDKSNVRVNFSPTHMTQTILVPGRMGAGKTTFFESLIRQNWYNRAVINDVKGDLKAKYFQPEDIIVSLMDERGMAFDIFSEMDNNDELAISFINNYTSAALGEKKDFWFNKAVQIVSGFVKKAYYEKTNSSERYRYLIEMFKNYEDDSEDQATKSSLAQVMSLVTDVFVLLNYLINEAGVPTFSVKEFFERKDGCRMFLARNSSGNSPTEKAFFTALVGVIDETLQMQPDIKPGISDREDYTFFLLDEYLSMDFAPETEFSLLTRARSKGGCIVIGLQYMDMDKKKSQQLQDSSRFAFVCFQMAEGDSIDRIVKMFGTVEYKEYTESVSVSVSTQKGGGNGGGGIGSLASAASGVLGQQSHSFSRSKNEAIHEKNFMRLEYVQSMDDYHHIMFIPSQGVVYLGLTDYEYVEESHEYFIKRDLSDFYKKLYGIQEVKNSDNSTAQISKTSVSQSTSKSTVLQTIPEKEKFFHYLEIKFELLPSEVPGYLAAHNLKDKVDELYDWFEQKPASIAQALERYDEDTRFGIMQEFYATDDKEKRYEIVSKYELFGALLTVFTFSREFLSRKGWIG